MSAGRLSPSIDQKLALPPVTDASTEWYMLDAGAGRGSAEPGGDGAGIQQRKGPGGTRGHDRCKCPSDPSMVVLFVVMFDAEKWIL